MAGVFLRLSIIRRLQLKDESIRRRRLRDATDPLDVPDELFIRYYRLSKDLFSYLSQKIRDCLPLKISRSNAIPLQISVLTILSFLATGSYQKIVGNDSHVNISQPSVSQHMLKIIDAINMFMDEWIIFPGTTSEREKNKQRFFSKFGVPGVIGCIDGTHVAVIQPSHREELYFNRKGYHSINATMICDADLRILAVCAKFGGATHDSHVWQTMAIHDYIEEINETGERGWLLGDSAYPLRETMMTPILYAEVNSPEENYTNKHCQARNTIERCFGVLKNRWRCLLRHRVLHYDPVYAGKLINACAVLHNMALSAGIEEPDDVENPEPPEQEVMPVLENEDALARGRITRQQLVNEMFAHL